MAVEGQVEKDLGSRTGGFQARTRTQILRRAKSLMESGRHMEAALALEALDLNRAARINMIIGCRALKHGLHADAARHFEAAAQQKGKAAEILEHEGCPSPRTPREKERLEKAFGEAFELYSMAVRSFLEEGNSKRALDCFLVAFITAYKTDDTRRLALLRDEFAGPLEAACKPESENRRSLCSAIGLINRALKDANPAQA